MQDFFKSVCDAMAAANVTVVEQLAPSATNGNGRRRAPRLWLRGSMSGQPVFIKIPKSASECRWEVLRRLGEHGAPVLALQAVGGGGKLHTRWLCEALFSASACGRRGAL